MGKDCPACETGILLTGETGSWLPCPVCGYEHRDLWETWRPTLLTPQSEHEDPPGEHCPGKKPRQPLDKR